MVKRLLIALLATGAIQPLLADEQKLLRISFNGTAKELENFKTNLSYPNIKDGVIINAFDFSKEESKHLYPEEELTSDKFINEACKESDPDKLAIASCTSGTNTRANLVKLAKILPDEWIKLKSEEGLSEIEKAKAETKIRLLDAKILLKSEQAYRNFYLIRVKYSKKELVPIYAYTTIITEFQNRKWKIPSRKNSNQTQTEGRVRMLGFMSTETADGIKIEEVNEQPK